MTLRPRAPSRQTRDVLTVLLQRRGEWLHGYELTKLAGLSSGTLYPLLIRLHERGQLEARWVDSAHPGRPERHVYRLSPQGVALARSLEREADHPALRPTQAIG
ncbi:MAG TPA: PadR family transcriptional regulator [Caulobacteraceae bacterium]|jgi:DNA-binding PadR family transcriptional regulator